MPPVARTVTTAMAWLGAVVVATAVGLMAVNAIGAGLVGPGEQVLDQAQVRSRLDAAAAVPTPALTAVPTTAPSVGPVAGADAAPEVIPSAGGTVVARCVDGQVDVVSATPAQGWGIHDEAEEEGDRVRFESDGARVELRLSCAGGRPQAQIRND